MRRAAFAAATLAACATTSQAEPPSLAGTAWTIERIGGVAPVSGAAPTARFDPGGRVTGTTGCNRYFASWRVKGDVLDVAGLGGTRMACPGPLMRQEARFQSLIAGSHVFRVEADGTLVIGDGVKGLRLAPAATGGPPPPPRP